MDRPLLRGAGIECLAQSVPVTRERVHARTRELAVTAGRSPLQITQADYEQARREITGESDMARQEARLENADRVRLLTTRAEVPVEAPARREAPCL